MRTIATPDESARPRAGVVRAARSRRQGLAVSARSISRRLVGAPERFPRDWAAERFARNVDLVRMQLAPVPTLTALADSYRREASVAMGDLAGAHARRAPTAVDVAYAIRWLELEHRTRMPAWAHLAGIEDG
jgi:hypothetical protein